MVPAVKGTARPTRHPHRAGVTRIVVGKLRDEGALTIVLVEQNSRVALAFSPRTVVMDRGRVVYDGPSRVLQDDPERLTRLIGVAE